MKKQIKKEHSTLSSYQLRRRTVEAPYKLEPSSNYYIENSNLSQKKISSSVLYQRLLQIISIKIWKPIFYKRN